MASLMAYFANKMTTICKSGNKRCRLSEMGQNLRYNNGFIVNVYGIQNTVALRVHTNSIEFMIKL